MTFTNFAALPRATARSTLLLLTIGAFTVMPARAEMYKCVQPDGSVLYQQTPCAVGTQKALDAESRVREEEARKQREATLKKAAQDEASREAKALEEVNREFKERAEASREAKLRNESAAEVPAKVSAPSATSALSLAAFERSPFFRKHKLISKDEWVLKSGGKNYSYSFPDPENLYSGIGVELNSNPVNVTKISVSWYGKSINEPATLTKLKEDFLRDLLASTILDIKPDTLISYVRGQKDKNYPDGGNAIPRKRLNGIAVYCGTVGDTLIVGIER